mmetsp:Transcript_69380/g.185098  ORF Transcript_69380/g.185098 Transcript_69380/m.185098 type:complete len:109 (-) Transcript_69380:1805-2131(-)
MCLVLLVRPGSGASFHVSRLLFLIEIAFSIETTFCSVMHGQSVFSKGLAVVHSVYDSLTNLKITTCMPVCQELNTTRNYWMAELLDSYKCKCRMTQHESMRWHWKPKN